jgi:hypothetical protein
MDQFATPALRLDASGPVTMEFVSTAIVVGLVLLGIGIVTNQLLRLKKWLKDSPPGPEPPES